MLADMFELDAQDGQPKFRSAGDDRFYTWAGRLYPRVTEILSAGSGHGLMNWYARVAAVESAAWLVAGGLVPEPEEGNPLFREINEWIDRGKMTGKSEQECLAAAADWEEIMLAAASYRDSRARVGSATHWAKAEIGLGLRTSPPDLEYLQGLIASKMVWPITLRHEEGEEGLVRDLAIQVLPHATAVWNWHELMRPEYEMLGIETCVVNRTEEYAGTLDEIAVYKRDVWAANMGGRWPFDPRLKEARVVADLKTSRSLRNTAKFQLAAYARAEIIGIFADCSEHALPEIHGLVAMHSADGQIKPSCWTEDAITPLFEGFCGLNVWFRAHEGMPRASRGRQLKEPPKGERENPIFVGGTK